MPNDEIVSIIVSDVIFMLLKSPINVVSRLCIGCYMLNKAPC